MQAKGAEKVKITEMGEKGLNVNGVFIDQRNEALSSVLSGDICQQVGEVF